MPSRHPNGYSFTHKARYSSLPKVLTADIANSTNSRRKFGLRLMTAEKHQIERRVCFALKKRTSNHAMETSAKGQTVNEQSRGISKLDLAGG